MCNKNRASPFAGDFFFYRRLRYRREFRSAYQFCPALIAKKIAIR